jgi:hypothetical protein
LIKQKAILCSCVLRGYLKCCTSTLYCACCMTILNVVRHFGTDKSCNTSSFWHVGTVSITVFFRNSSTVLLLFQPLWTLYCYVCVYCYGFHHSIDSTENCNTENRICCTINTLRSQFSNSTFGKTKLMICIVFISVKAPNMNELKFNIMISIARRFFGRISSELQTFCRWN